MQLLAFPDPRSADENGIVAVGGNLHWQNLLTAYRAGIFPWPIENLPLTWFSPPARAILDFDELHLPRSLEKARRSSTLRFTIDRAFPRVIAACATVRRGDQSGTWITRGIIKNYVELHQQGHAHSVEAWEDDELVGGLYGVDAGGIFAGESMFHLQPDSSKLALLHLIDQLGARGSTWIDIQVMTPHMAALGAREIARDEFLLRLQGALARGLELFPKAS